MPMKAASKKSKKKSVKVSDGERAINDAETYRKVLEEEFYIPAKCTRVTQESQLSRIDAVISASIPTQSPNEASGLPDHLLPASKLEAVMHGLQLVPTQEQLQQIAAMTAADGRGTGADVTHLLDCSKLRALLASILETRTLVPPVESVRDAVPSLSAKCVSVVYRADEVSIQKCFETLWEATGSLVAGSEGEPVTRYIDTEYLRAVFTHMAEMSSTTSSFPVEIFDVILSVCSEPNERVLREDTFLLNFLDV